MTTDHVDGDIRLIGNRLPAAKAYALFWVNERGSLELSVNGTMKLLAEVIAPALRENADIFEQEWREDEDASL